MSAPKTIWAFHDGPMVGLFIGKKEVGSNIAEYTLTDPTTITLDRAEYEALVEALEFYADKSGWNQPPVKTRDSLISVEYENQASKIQRYRGSIAVAALKEVQS